MGGQPVASPIPSATERVGRSGSVREFWLSQRGAPAPSRRPGKSTEPQRTQRAQRTARRVIGPQELLNHGGHGGHGGSALQDKSTAEEEHHTSKSAQHGSAPQHEHYRGPAARGCPRPGAPPRPPRPPWFNSSCSCSSPLPVAVARSNRPTTQSARHDPVPR